MELSQVFRKKERLCVTQLSSNLKSNYFSEQSRMTASLCISHISSRSTTQKNTGDTIKTVDRGHLMIGVFIANVEHMCRLANCNTTFQREWRNLWILEAATEKRFVK